MGWSWGDRHKPIIRYLNSKWSLILIYHVRGGNQGRDEFICSTNGFEPSVTPPFIFLSFSLVVLRLTQASHTPPTGGVWAFNEKNRYQIRFLELPLNKKPTGSSIQGQGGSVNSEVDLRIKNWKGRPRSWEPPFEFQIHHVQSNLAIPGKCSSAQWGGV